MTIYVDTIAVPWRGRRWCHLFTDGDQAELHAFAARLGLKRAWYQQPPRARWRHYDLVIEKRPQAIAFGAVIADRWKVLEIACGKRALARMRGAAPATRKRGAA